MPIARYIVDNAIDILQRKGIIFEDDTEVGSCLKSKGPREEFIEQLKKHFDFLEDRVECQSLCIPIQGNYYYYVFIWDTFEEINSDYEFYKDAIRAEASTFYGVSQEEISFDFL